LKTHIAEIIRLARIIWTASLIQIPHLPHTG
jgi:hypothetical protein